MTKNEKHLNMIRKKMVKNNSLNKTTMSFILWFIRWQKYRKCFKMPKELLDEINIFLERKKRAKEELKKWEKQHPK